MCGIAGFTGKDKAVPYLIDCLEKLEYRGYDSAGIALCGEKNFEVTKCKGKLSVLTSVLFSKKQSNSFCGIGHTRWATHGKPDEKNAHPHLSQNGMFAVVHNGIIENYSEIKRDLISNGFTFNSETDTEVIAQLLEKNYRGDFVSAVKKTLEQLDGSYAVAIMCRDYPGQIFCSRWGSPIVLASNDKGNFISSDVTSVLKYTDEVYRLEGGESALVCADKIDFFDRQMNVISKKTQKVNWSVEDAQKGGFEHFMLKEIFEQGETADKILCEYVKENRINFPDFKNIEKRLSEIKRIVFIGCGSAYHVGMSGKYVAEKLTGIYSSAEVASEWRYGDSPVDKSCLAVFISQSGETADTLAALRKAKSKGALTLGIVNVVSSSVACESDFVIYTLAGPEIAVATTKAYTAQLLTVYMLSIEIGRIKGSFSEDDYRRLVSKLLDVPEKILQILKNIPERARSLAMNFYTAEQMYFIGRNTDYAAAMEGALKLKEVSYIPCEAYAAGELKHGTISLIEKGTVVVALLGNGEVLLKTLSNVKEVKSRGARVLAVGDFDGCETENEEGFDCVLPIGKTVGLFSSLYEGIVLQLFAYYTARLKGCDIDKPRNLAKSVTVE